MRILAAIGYFILTMSITHAYEQAFTRTEPGNIEIKTLPGGRLLESQGEGDYFNQSDNLFGPLFRYISNNDISMTTPVEARINPGTMYFWVGEGQAEKAREDTTRVKVIDVDERLVAAIGERGGYSKSNYEEAKEKLLQWIEKQEGLEITGDAFAVYWNSPFTPFFLKKFEVLIPVTKKVS